MKRSLRVESVAEGPGFDVEDAMKRVEATIQRAIECDEPLLRRMVTDLVTAGGKRLRPRIALLAFQACGGTDPSPAIDAAAAFELIHTASLVHDDIIDQSPLRRGRPTLHVAYGIPHALVAGDFLFTQGFALSGSLTKEVIAVTAEACVRLAEGEVMEQRLLAEEVDEERYLKIIIKKTAEPIRACAKAGALLAGVSPDMADALGQYGLEVGIAFQIADDVLDIAGNPEETGKVVGQDSRNGVITLPVGIFGRAGGPAEDRTGGTSDRVFGRAGGPTEDRTDGTSGRVGEDVSTFRQLAREVDSEELRARLQEAGAIDKAREVATRYVERAKSRLDALPPSPAKDELLAIADIVVKRRN